ncbi:MAG: VTT domain-containing protein [Proteobacteria bacterium]|nr:VTT domain-containing protein [Pseudomonadota bacterium]
MDSILDPGRNCWKVFEDVNVSFLIDAEDYFRDLRRSLLDAGHTIYIAGWDINSRIELVRRGEKPGHNRLGPLLDHLVREKSGLNVYILDWDFSTILQPQRELLPLVKFRWQYHDRLRFQMDDKHPVGASHHQKIVVIDDAVAYCGGMDLTAYRWDTREHRKDDPGRTTPNGRPYNPYHDVQARVDGRAARALGDLFRDRWTKATTGSAAKPEAKKESMESRDWDCSSARVGIARTFPAYEDQPEIREIENLYLDLIQSARQTIYIENQYLTSETFTEALAQSLSRKDGPEVIVVLTKDYTGWLGEQAMKVLRTRAISRLRAADGYGRLGIYYPVIPGIEPEQFTVHSKVMVVDDLYARVGSSNLSGRSMGLDTECDLLVDGTSSSGTREGVRFFKARLLAEHLGMDPGQVLQAIDSGSTMKELIESRSGKKRALVKLPERDEPEPSALKVLELTDPDHAVNMNFLKEHFFGEEDRKTFIKRNKSLLGFLAIAGLAVLVPLLWFFTPLGEMIDPGEMEKWFSILREEPLTPLFVVLLYAFGGLLFVPLNLLIISTAVAFPTIPALAYVLTGSLLSSLAGYAVGRLLGKSFVRDFFPAKAEPLYQRLSQGGFVPVLLVRIIPVAPFTSINLFAGAIPVRFRSYMLGTLLGILPGGISLVVFQRSLLKMITDFDPVTLILALGALAFFLGVFLFFRKRYHV